MRIKNTLLLGVFLLISQCFGQTFSVMSWNIQDLGRTKDDQELQQMANIMKAYDVIAIQEVVAKDPAGARAVASLADQLNRMGNSWDYRVSDPTNSPSPHIRERYAFIWKRSKIQLVGRPFLDQTLAKEIYREPYIGKFKVKGSDQVWVLVNFHSRKYNDQPEQEIKYFADYPRRFNSSYLIIAGDFNMNEEHKVWNALYKQGFVSALNQTPTTLKRACNTSGNYLNHPIDNFYLHQQSFHILSAKALDIVQSCEKLQLTRNLSDHLPVILSVELK